MPRGPLRTDLSLLDQGIAVGLEFGVHSVVELARLGEMLLHSVYEPGSLRVEGVRATFTLRNPPLRMGAFRSMEVAWDGAPVPPADVTVTAEGFAPRVLSAVDRTHPFTIPVGRRTTVTLGAVDLDSRRHRVRFQLQSVAIPPTVWYEFSDILRPGVPP